MAEKIDGLCSVEGEDECSVDSGAEMESLEAGLVSGNLLVDAAAVSSVDPGFWVVLKAGPDFSGADIKSHGIAANNAVLWPVIHSGYLHQLSCCRFVGYQVT